MKWEYEIRRVRPSINWLDDKSWLNNMGEKEWELVSITIEYGYFFFYFKREKKEDV